MESPQFGIARPVQFNVTPLIDVVLLLIIFFLVSSHLAQQETQMEVALPKASSGREAATNRVARVTIHLLKDGSLHLGGSRTSAEEVVRRLQAERHQTSSDLEVRIRVDRQATYQQLEPLLLACTESHIWNVSFAVIDKMTHAEGTQ